MGISEPSPVTELKNPSLETIGEAVFGRLSLARRNDVEKARPTILEAGRIMEQTEMGTVTCPSNIVKSQRDAIKGAVTTAGTQSTLEIPTWLPPVAFLPSSSSSRASPEQRFTMLALVSFISLFLSLVDFGCALKFNFTDVGQCEQIMISFNGPLTTRRTPTRISIIPLNSSPIFIPFPNVSLISSGLGLTFLPLPSGANFLATLDDDTGDNVINVSDLIRILPTAQNRTDCLPPVATAAPRQFQLVTPPRQCETFTIRYNTTVVKRAPNVRLYSPKGPSFLLPVQTDDTARGRATYNMNYPRGFEIVLVMDDGREARESTSLLTSA